MWINGLTVVLVFVVVYNVGHTSSEIQKIARKQVQISSISKGVGGEDVASSDDGIGNIFLARNIGDAFKRVERHKDDDKSLIGRHKEDRVTIVEKKKRGLKRKHVTQKKKNLHKTRTRKWGDILAKIKHHKTKHSHKLNSKNKDDLKKDKQLHGTGITTENKQVSEKSDNNEDKDKHSDEQEATEDNLSKSHDRVSFGDETKRKSAKTGKKSHKKKGHHKNKDDEVDAKFLNGTQLEALRDSLLVHPFEIWKFKDRFNSMEDLGIHEALLQDVVENKRNTRLKHKLFKVFKGENIHLAVIGGSNTAGGGIQKDEGRTDGLFFRVILDWWQKAITPLTGSHLKTRQIAMGGTSSDFFQYCHHSYVQEDVDLVLLEMSVNDLHELPYNANLSLPIEQLTRQLLEYPTEPALLYVNLLSGRSYYQGCTNLEDFGQRLLSDTYEVTTLSWRDAVCPVIDGKFRVPLKGCSVVCKDGHHINQLGHAHISLMLIDLFRDLLLDNIGHVNELKREVFHDELVLPKAVFIAEQSKIITEPLCWTTVTPNFKRKIIKNSMQVGVMENFGFDYVHDKAIGGGHCFTEDACRADAYSGWTGQDVGARLTLSFTVPPLGHKRRIQSRSVVFATRTCWKCGVVEVWLDDDFVNRRRIRAQSQYAQTLLEIVALRVNPGDHTMSLKVVHPGFVSVVGVMLGPPDGPY
jgi:hypothetical protein